MEFKHSYLLFIVGRTGDFTDAEINENILLLSSLFSLIEGIKMEMTFSFFEALKRKQSSFLFLQKFSLRCVNSEGS